MENKSYFRKTLKSQLLKKLSIMKFLKCSI